MSTPISAPDAATEPPAQPDVAPEPAAAIESPETVDVSELADSPATAAPVEGEAAQPAEGEANVEGEADKPAEEPKVEEPKEDEALKFASMARLQSKVTKAQREVKAAQSQLVAQRKQLEEQANLLKQEMETFRADPFLWLSRKGVTPDEFASKLQPKPEPPDKLTVLEQQLAETRKMLEERDRRDQEMALQAKRARYESQVQAAADEFAEWATQEDNAVEYPITAAMLSADRTTRNEALAQWRALQEAAAKSGFSYSAAEVAAAMEELAAGPIQKLVERYQTYSAKRSSKTTTTAANQKTAGNAASSGQSSSRVPQTITSQMSAQKASAQKAVDVTQMSDAELEAYYAREYERELKKNART